MSFLSNKIKLLITKYILKNTSKIKSIAMNEEVENQMYENKNLLDRLTCCPTNVYNTEKMTGKTMLLFVPVRIHLKTERRQQTFIPDFFIVILQLFSLNPDLVLYMAINKKHTTVTQPNTGVSTVFV